MRPVVKLVALAVGAGVAVVAGRAAWRAKARACPSCGVAMVRLGDGEKQAFLAVGEKVEERIGSMDHDVWRCPACRKREKVRWPAMVSAAASCGVCRFRTMTVVSRVAVGRTHVEVLKKCEHCGARESATQSTRRPPL